MSRDAVAVQVDGQISANGQQPCQLANEIPHDPASCPLCPSYPLKSGASPLGCSGGSGAAGGTIIIEAYQSGNPLAINGTGTVQANGASADVHCAPSSSGGGGGGGW